MFFSRILARAATIAPHERGALAAAFAYFFCLLCSYYMLRPVRDEMAVQAGVASLPWLFTAIFASMLALTPVFGWLAARMPRARLLPAVYVFFALNLVGFYVALQSGASMKSLAPAYFVWVSVFNLFAVSVFWSFMADLFDSAQAKRLFGVISAGGSCGAIAGPALTAASVGWLGPANLLLLAAGLLILATGCIAWLGRWALRHPRAGDADAPEAPPLGGSIFAGVRAAFSSPYLLGICAWLLCYTMLSTTLYFQQTEIVAETIADPRERTRLFATVDLTVNILTLLAQLLLFAPLVARLGVGRMLALMPVVSLVGFACLGAAPTLAVLLVFGVTRRAGEFALSKPVREALYTVLSREEKYKAKNFIDTVVYRGGDTLSSWMVGFARSIGLGISGVAYAALPVAAAWVAVSFYLGRRQAELAAKV